MEELSKDIPEPRVKSVTITIFLYALHASYKRKRRSHIAYAVFVNRDPIIFYSKQKSTVESSTFLGEFITMKTCKEHIIGLRFKLQIFGIYIVGPAIMLNDN